MDFRRMLLRSIGPVFLLGLLLMGLLFWKFSSKTEYSIIENDGTQNKGLIQNLALAPQITSKPAPVISKEEEAAIQAQLDRDRKQQKQTKDLKIKLEQTNLQLEQEKALAEINKLKKENVGAFNEPAVGGQNNLPEIKVNYIGGNSTKKEAIVSINGASYQVKEKSSPTADIQVISISNSGVTLHFSVPEELTKTIDYKPE